MKNISRQFLLAVMSAGILFSSCKKDFLDINDNPNTPTDDNITPELIFTAAAEGVGAANVGARASGAGARSSMQFAQDWVGYMAGNGDFARDNTETSYNLDFSFGNTLFLTRYNVLYDLNRATTKGLATGDTTVAAASMILSAKMFQELVDLFGNIPYSQAFQTDLYPRPVYDKAEDIYADLQKKLDTAIEYMKKPAPIKFKPADIVNHGDQGRWIKFANTLKLRLLIRQSEIATPNLAAEIAKIESNGGVLGAGETVSVNPGYVNEINKQSPFYANYGYTPTDVKATTGTNANDFIITLLGVTNDPRLGRFFAPAGNGYFGNVYGLPPGDLLTGASTSYFGPGVLSSPSQDQWIMPSYESLFFLAEAQARGWMTGDAGATFNTAMRESFLLLGISAADVDAALETYIEDSGIADYSSATALNDRIDLILIQKYIANTTIDPLESYSDIRRTNFLQRSGLVDALGVTYISQNESRVSSTLPVRLLYPQSEYTTNADNVNQQGTINAFTSKIFWQP